MTYRVGVFRRRISTPKAAVAGLLVLAFGLCGCLSGRSQPPVPLARVDMSRMYGGWYLIATRKNGFETRLVGPYDVYSKRPDGDIREDFYVRKGSFQAPLKHFTLHDWVRPGTNNAHWRVQVLWPINLPFLVLYTDPDYRYVLFGEDNRKLGWVYSRTPTVPETDYQALIAHFKGLGYDTSTFVRFVQSPDQIGKPGVWSRGSAARGRRLGVRCRIGRNVFWRPWTRHGPLTGRPMRRARPAASDRHRNRHQEIDASGR